MRIKRWLYQRNAETQSSIMSPPVDHDTTSHDHEDVAYPGKEQEGFHDSISRGSSEFLSIPSVPQHFEEGDAADTDFGAEQQGCSDFHESIRLISPGSLNESTPSVSQHFEETDVVAADKDPDPEQSGSLAESTPSLPQHVEENDEDTADEDTADHDLDAEQQEYSSVLESISLVRSTSESLDESTSSVSQRLEETDSCSALSEAPVEDREIKFRIKSHAEMRSRLLSSIAWLSCHIPTVVLQRLLKETISVPSLPYCSSDDDDVMSGESSLSDVSDIDDHMFGTKDTPTIEPPTIEPSPKSHARSLGSGKIPLMLLCPSNDTGEENQTTDEPQTDGNKIGENERVHILMSRSLGGGKIPLMLPSPSNDSDEEESRESVVCIQYDLDRNLALRALGINSGRPQKSSEMAYSVEAKTVTFKDPFPYDSDDERSTAERYSSLIQNKMGSQDEKQKEGKITSDYHSSVCRNKPRDGDVVVVNGRGLPFASRRETAILSIAIAGLTNLSTILDPESLSKTINTFFESIINEATAHGGDVLKFVRGAVLVEWSTVNRRRVPLKGSQSCVPSTLGECAFAAALCAAKVVSKYSDFQVATLNVYCGLGVGEVVGVHIGGHQSRREYIVLGDPLDQISDASHCARLGEVVASGKALKALATVCELDQDILVAGYDQPRVIATRNLIRWGEIRDGLKATEAVSRDLVGKVARKLPTKSLERYRQLISSYTQPIVATIDETIFDGRKGNSSDQERPGQETELLSAFVVCIAPLISVQLSGNDQVDQSLFVLLNDIMELTTRELSKFNGDLRQVIIDHKRVVLVATFGLQGSTNPNMVAQFALPATISIHNGLQHELGVQNRVGGTYGNASCGVVGGSKRQEYVIMGPSVDLAAQLMASPENPGILVDHAVRKMADKSYAFNALAPVKAKGYRTPVPIFEPLSPLQRSWGCVQPNFVGRKAEIMTMIGTAKEMSSHESASSMIFLYGESGVGKNATIVHTLEHIRRTMKASRRRLVLTNQVCKETDLLLPFGVFSSVLLGVLQFYQGWPEERLVATRGSLSSLESIDLESLSGYSAGAASNQAQRSVHTDTLSLICREMNAPPEFAEVIGHRLLGFDLPVRSRSDGEQRTSRSISFNKLIDFVARVFVRCTQDSSLTVIALDDVHNMDELSWQVMQVLFETSHNMLFIFSVKGLSPVGSCLSNTFLDTLNNDRREDGRFRVLMINELPEDDMKQLIAKTLGLRLKDVAPRIVQSIVTQSRGCPHIASAILESMKRHSPDTVVGRAGLDENDERIFNTVDELFVYRIDSLEASVRNVLSIGAVLGTSFELLELVAFVRENAGGDETGEQTRQTCKALESAVEEGILYMSQDINNDDENDFYNSCAALSVSNLSTQSDKHGTAADRQQMPLRFTFSNDVWRSTILNLMLDSRKRDLHLTIADSLQSSLKDDTSDFLSMMNLFAHWKASGSTEQAAKVALSIASSYEELYLHTHSIRLLKATLEMWSGMGDITKDAVESLTQEDLDSLTTVDLKLLIQLCVALGRALTNVDNMIETVAIYQNALVAASGAKASDEFDRSLLFPIFTSLFSAIEYGMIEQDDEMSFEQSLVARFVQDTCIHGDPVHFSRALAMQAEVLARLGNFDGAVLVHLGLTEVYDPKEHSVGITEAYGSDSVARCFGQSASWYNQIDDTEAALEMCDYILSHLLPTMARRDVHNSMMTLYPVLWVLKDNGRSLEAKKCFQDYVLNAFQEYGDEGASVSFQPIFEPIRMLLDLASGTTTEHDRHEFVEWALIEDNSRFDFSLNCTMGNVGRCPGSISAEICLLLARIHSNADEVSMLIQTGLTLAMEMLSLTKERRLLVAHSQVLPVYLALNAMASEGDIVSPKGIDFGARLSI